MQANSQNKMEKITKMLNTEIQTLRNQLKEKEDVGWAAEETNERLKEDIEKANSMLAQLQVNSESKVLETSKALNFEIQMLKSQLKEKIDAGGTVEKLLADHNNEIEELKIQLKNANDQLAKYRARQEKVDKTLRAELAKTHNVLKKTKNNLENCK